MSITYLNERPTIIVKSGMGPGILYNRDPKRPVFIGRDGSIVYGNENSGSILDPLASLYVGGDTDIFAVAPMGTTPDNAVPVDFIHAGRSQYHQSATILSEPINQVATGITGLGELTAEMQQLLTDLSTMSQQQIQILQEILAAIGGAPVPTPAVSDSIVPSDLGLIAWTASPIGPATGTATLTTGNLFHMFFASFNGGIINNLYAVVTTGGTTTGFWAGIYDRAGSLLGTTDNLSSLTSTVGNKTMPLTSPLTLQPGTVYRIAVLVTGSSISINSTAIANTVITAGTQGTPANYPAGVITGLTGATALPATIDPSLSGFSSVVPRIVMGS